MPTYACECCIKTDLTKNNNNLSFKVLVQNPLNISCYNSSLVQLGSYFLSFYLIYDEIVLTKIKAEKSGNGDVPTKKSSSIVTDRKVCQN